MPENSGGWGSLYNGGVGIQGGFGGTSTEYATWAALLSAIQADDNDADNSPKIYLYTGPDVTLGETEVVNITGLNRKTIYANAGQTISRGELRFVQCDDIIIRNWKRRGPYYPTGTGAGEANLDYFTFNECFGYWVDHCDMDAEFQYNGAGDEYPDGMIDTNLSDDIVISNCRVWNGQRGILIGYSDTQVANDGLLNTTIRNCWFKNNGGRQPKGRFGKIHLLNNLGNNVPIWDSDWSPENKPSGQHFMGVDAKSQFYSENSYYDDGQSLARDDDNEETPVTSGLIFDGDFIGTFDFTGGTVSMRPENVLWDPATEPGYDYPVPLMSPTDAKAYAEKWAGANYHLIRTLTLNDTGSGTTSEISTGLYKDGDSVEVLAIPDSGWSFVRWTVDSVEVSTNASYTFNIGADDVDLVAVFQEITYALTTQVNNVLAGTITEVTTGPYAEGATVQVSANTNSGYVFGEFASDQIANSGDNPHSFLMPAQNVTVTAMFYPTYDLTLEVDPTGLGTVDQNPDGPRQEGDTVELSAIPGSGNQFDGWYDGETLLSTDNPYDYTMPSADKTITGKFSDSGLDTYSLTLTIDPVGFGTASKVPVGPYESGTVVQLSADPGSNRKFLGWYDGITLLSTNNPYNYTTGGADKTITVKFEDGGVIIARRMII